MNDGHAGTVTPAENVQHLGGQPDLGEQDDRAPPAVQHAVHHLKDHPGLAASRYTVKQGRARLSRLCQRRQRGYCLGLLGAERLRLSQRGRQAVCGRKRSFLLDDGQKLLFCQCLERRGDTAARRCHARRAVQIGGGGSAACVHESGQKTVLLRGAQRDRLVLSPQNGLGLLDRTA